MHLLKLHWQRVNDLCCTVKRLVSVLISPAHFLSKLAATLSSLYRCACSPLARTHLVPSSFVLSCAKSQATIATLNVCMFTNSALIEWQYCVCSIKYVCLCAQTHAHPFALAPKPTVLYPFKWFFSRFLLQTSLLFWCWFFFPFTLFMFSRELVWTERKTYKL